MTGDVELLHPATVALAAVSSALDEFTAANLWSMPTGELGRLVIALEHLGRRLDAARVAATGQAQVSLVAEREGATSLAAWLKAVADVPVGVSRSRLTLHQALATRPIVAAAFSAGEIGQDAAAAVCAAIDGLPGAVPAALTGDIETLLVEVARDEGTRAVVLRAADIVHRFAPEQLECDEAAQLENTRLKLRLRHDGTVSVRGVLDKEAGALAFAVFGPLAAPSPASDGTPDFRDAETRYGHAFVRVLQLASASAPAVRGERPRIVVTIGLDSMRAEPGSAPGRLDTGVPISAGAARRLACDATIVPLVLGSNSEPLDIGRASRLIPSGLRRALVARDQGCDAGLRSAAQLVRRSPPQALVSRRRHQPRQPVSAMRKTPHDRPFRRLADRADRRARVVHPAPVARFHTDTTPEQPLQIRKLGP